jgi:hypothetical protein
MSKMTLVWPDHIPEYDPNLWYAIPDSNRFDDIEVSFGDRAGTSPRLLYNL